MVKKSEKHISDALKKAQEEESKIFALFLDVIKEKKIKIDISGIRGSEIGDNLNNATSGETKTHTDLNNVLLSYLSLESNENDKRLGNSLIAISRKNDILKH